MEYQAVIEILGFAAANERTVTIVTTDGHRVTGVPTSVDEHPTALEVFLHPEGDDSTEIAIALTAIGSVHLV